VNLELLQRQITAFDPLRDQQAQHALAQLSALHSEQARDYSENRFLARSPLACVTLMAAASAVLLLTGAGLRPGFVWAALLLAGIVAMVRNFIRGTVRGLGPVSPQKAADDLRLQLFYSGAVWAAGAELLMPAMPSAALVFTYAIAPALALALILKDAGGVRTFTAPAAIGTAAMAIFNAWPLSVWVPVAIVAAGFGIMLLPALQHGDKNRIPALPLP
jgi:hypothetical protein